MFTTFNKKPKLKLFSHKWLWDALDDLVSRIVRIRTPYCVTCGANSNLTCSHIFGRAHGPTRFDIDPGGDCVTQCMNCNNLHNTNRGPLFGWYVKHFGERALEDLERRAVSERHYSYLELRELYERYKAILKQEKAA